MEASQGGSPNLEKVGGPKGGAQKGGAPKGGGPKFRSFFPSPATIFFLLSLGSFRGILVVFLKAGTLKCARLGSPHRQDTRHKTQDTRHKTQDTRHKTQDTRHKTQDTRHKTQDTRHKTQDNTTQDKNRSGFNTC